MIKEGEDCSLQRFLRQFGQYASRTTSERLKASSSSDRTRIQRNIPRDISYATRQGITIFLLLLLLPLPERSRARRSRQRLFADFPVVFRSSRRADEKFFSAASVILLPRKKSSFFQMDRSLGGNDHRLIVRLKSPPSSHRASDKS